MSYDIISHSIRSEVKENLSLSVPLISSQLIYACSGFIATVMVAHLGEDALAASILVSMVWMCLNMFFFGTLNSISVLVSHQFGAKNNAAISEIMGQAFLLGILTTVCMIVIMLILPHLMQWSNQPANVLQLASSYIYSLIWTIPALVILIICEQFLAGANQAKLVLRVSMLVVPMEILAIYILVFGKLGLPALGLAGVGYGFAISFSITATFLTLYLLKSKKYLHFKIFAGIKHIHLNYLKELLRVGLPMGFMHVIEIGAFAVATFWIGEFSTTLLAAHQIVMQFLSFIITIVFAMSQAVTIRIGYAIGKENLTEIRYAAYVGMVMNFILIFFIMLAFELIPKFFLRLDLDVNNPANALLIHDASVLLSVCGVLLLFDNFRLIGFGALRGLKDTRFPMYVSLFCFWVIGLGLAYLFGFHFSLQGTGIWWGLTAGIAAGAIILFIRFQYLIKRVDLNKILKIEG